jgi:hypothetical protein
MDMGWLIQCSPKNKLVEPKVLTWNRPVDSPDLALRLRMPVSSSHKVPREVQLATAGSRP